MKPSKKLTGADGKRLNLAEYMKEHVYMFLGNNVHVKFRTTLPLISDIIDMFGSDVRFSDKDENGVTVSVYTNEMSMVQFAKTYVPDVVVLEPQSLADKVKDDLSKAIRLYK